jgi:multimeric flavodoxin WrbA
MRPKLLAIIGSHRKNGNSYTLAKTVLDNIDVNAQIIQLSDEEIQFCTLCEKCTNDDCTLQDDFNEILHAMKEADGLVFTVPKYLFHASKFLAYLERLATINHMREYRSYERGPRTEYKLFSDKPFCILTTSGTGETETETVRITTEYLQGLGLTLIQHDHAPFLGANIATGDKIGSVLKNTEGIAEGRRLIEKLATSLRQ